jgi:hypothetical protein
MKPFERLGAEPDSLEHVFNDSGYRTVWARLLPADKAVLRALVQGVNDLHSLPTRPRLGEDLGPGKSLPWTLLETRYFVSEMNW